MRACRSLTATLRQYIIVSLSGSMTVCAHTDTPSTAGRWPMRNAATLAAAHSALDLEAERGSAGLAVLCYLYIYPCADQRQCLSHAIAKCRRILWHFSRSDKPAAVRQGCREICKHGHHSI